MSYLLSHYEDEGDRHWCRLSRMEGRHIEHVLSASLTSRELEAFIAMLKKLDPATEVTHLPGAYR
jgi:hypothetical protein